MRDTRKAFANAANAYAWSEHRTAAADLARRDQVRAVIATNAAAVAFDHLAARSLAARDLYAPACGALAKTIGWPPANEMPHVMMWQSIGGVLAFRLAYTLGIVPVSAIGKSATERVGIDWLRDRAPECEKARTVLALLGEMPDWSAAGPRERAAYLLHHVVEARR